MKTLKEYPPNYSEIKDYFPEAERMKAVFSYGDTIYNPFNSEIPPDLELHETVHSKQQQDNPGVWWTKYCLDKDFRQEQEVEAYARQYMFIKKYMPKVIKEALDDFASALSSNLYNLNLTHPQAHTLIRLKARELARS